MNPFNISFQVAVIVGAMAGFITYHFLLRKAIDQAFKRGSEFGIKEGLDAGFAQGVVLSIRGLRQDLKPIGVIVDKDVTITNDARPGLYKLQTFVEIVVPGQDSVLEMPPGELHQLRPQQGAEQ